MWSTVARNLQLQRGRRTGPIVTCPSPDRTDPSDLNPANLNPAAPSPLGAVNKAPERSGYSFLTYLTTATATTTTTTSAANPATTITATGSSDIPFDSPFKGLSSKEEKKALIFPLFVTQAPKQKKQQQQQQ
ncbi:hypothetical protein P8C59_000036 [Phyllachora maydis]|uniref:Uncharacterized protein n=1 Tax=Phyllachora maydis TaxID=1825666 RepID=A0AAD9HV87_9PEZI|nr:hypothetical protein P8C59_000036 [Phyllachora maydis]